MYSFSTISNQRPVWPSLQSTGARGRYSRTPTSKTVVCCCPWPGSGSKSSTYENSASVKKVTFSDKQLPLPPGPSLLPLTGHLHYMIRSVPYHHVLADLAKEYGPLLHFNVGELSFVVVSSPEMVKELLKANDVACAYGPKSKVSRVISFDYRNVVTALYGDYWKQVRHICVAELLCAKNVNGFDFIREEQGSILIEGIRSAPRSSPLNLTGKILEFMNAATCRAIFGNVSMDRARLITVIRRNMVVGGSLELADLFPSIELLNLISFNAYDHVPKRMPELEGTLDGVIEKHRRNAAETGEGYGEQGAEDFVDVLLRLKERDGHLLQFPLTDDTIKALIDILGAGTESASSAVEWTMAELVRNPRVMLKLQAEIREAFHGKKTMEESKIRKLSYVKMVVKESMRLHPLIRPCSEDFEIGAYRIPKDAFIVVNVWRLARDPKNWREPERFEGNSMDLVGNHFEYIPMICPGIAFTLANVEFLLAQLLYYYDWKLPVGIRAEDLDMTESGGFAVSRQRVASI